MVREKWFVDRSPSRAAPSQGRCMSMQVCGCLCLARLGWIKMDGWIPPDAFTPAAGPPGIHLPRLDSTGTCQGPGVDGLTDKQEQIERAKPKPREGVSVCRGRLPLASNHPPTHPQYAHNPPTRLASLSLVQRLPPIR